MKRASFVRLSVVSVMSFAASWLLSGTALAMPTCGNGLVESPEACDEGIATGTSTSCCQTGCTLRPAGEVCRPSAAGICDIVETCDGATSDCPADAFVGGADRAVEDAGNQHCYLGFDDDETWQGAESACEDLNGTLAIIGSPAENALVRTATSLASETWIGMHDLVEASNNALGFQNVGGGTIEYADFSLGEPNNNSPSEDCVSYSSGVATWHDKDCTNLIDYVCELEPDPCGDGVVQSSASEDCDQGHLNGTEASCCNADCSFASAGTDCRSAGGCELESAECTGSSGGCSSTGSFLAGADSGSYDGLTGHCYLRFTSELSWTDAADACASVGGDLAVIDSGHENMVAVPTSHFQMWIGISDRAAEAGTNPLGFEKIDGSGLIDYHAFGRNEPNDSDNEDCVEVSQHNYVWNDSVCDNENDFICEIDSVIEPCPASPVACKAGAAGKGQLLLKARPGLPKKSLLMWKWSSGELTTPAELGNPTQTTDYRLCLYDDDGNVAVDLLVPGGGVCKGKTCWKATGKDDQIGYIYKNKGGGLFGTSGAVFKAGPEGKASMLVKAKGEALALPELPLPQISQPVVVQLHNGDECWGASYSGPAKKAEPDTLFLDTND